MADAVDGLDGTGLPDPAAADTAAEFVDGLRRVLRGSGLSYREVEKRTRATEHPLPRSTLTAALARDTLPREGVVTALVRACGGDEEDVQRWAAARRRIAAAPDPDAGRAGTDPTSPSPGRGPGPEAGSRPGPWRTGPPIRAAAVAVVLVLAVTALAVIVGRALITPGGADPAGARGEAGVPPTVPQGTPLGRDQPCPDGWLCLYEHPHFNQDRAGRVLQFQDDYWQPLQEWDFDNHASSVRNHLGRDACVSADWPVGAAKHRIVAGAALATLADWDNQASGIKLGPC